MLEFPRKSVSIFFAAFNMVSEQCKDETIDTIVDETQTKTDKTAAAAGINAAGM